MSTVLIVDPSKPSMVMSSEVFKDKVPGITVLVASTGKEALEIVTTKSQSKVDLCVVDFDLPDTDGVTLIHFLRKNFSGPILLTAYPDDVVSKAAAEELFAYDDAGMWVKKPIRAETLNEKIDRFLIGKFRVQRRFDFQPKTRLLGKSEGRGKRTPKFPGQLVNVSVGGACIKLSTPAKLKNGEEVTIEMPIPKTDKSANEIASIKSRIVWKSKDNKQVGISFDNLTEQSRKTINRLLKALDSKGK